MDGNLPLVNTCYGIQTTINSDSSNRKVDFSFAPKILLNPLAAYTKLDFRFSPTFSVNTLIKSITFTHNFKSSGRNAVYFGFNPYTYTGGCHLPKPISSNIYINELFKFVSMIMPSMMLNSCLINHYPDSSADLPFHSDDEKCIRENSYIVTLSLGASRTMYFKDFENKLGTEYLYSTELQDGDIIIFSKESQFKYLHGIPALVSSDCQHSTSSRISATFRSINNS